VTAARNEEQYLEPTILAGFAQTVRPVKWIIVSDGSPDGTAKIIDRYAASSGWIERLAMPTHRERNFAAKAHCVNSAGKAVNGLDYEVRCRSGSRAYASRIRSGKFDLSVKRSGLVRSAEEDWRAVATIGRGSTLMRD
jgi:glycosyltransferase involved in cell wall biosynthesis